VGDRIDEEEDADPGIGLLESRFDRADQGRDQEAGPADEEHARTGEGGSDPGPPGGGEGHGLMLTGGVASPPGRWTGALSSGDAGETCTTARDAQWRAVLRPRRQRDLGRTGRERGPPRG